LINGMFLFVAAVSDIHLGFQCFLVLFAENISDNVGFPEGCQARMKINSKLWMGLLMGMLGMAVPPSQ
ncbi:hypothetical protein, partial [Yersinia pestis]|uniref:hypothetical protein n=1 Tax=Yersinia pestis TaxID=632 RepID=UPI0005778335